MKAAMMIWAKITEKRVVKMALTPDKVTTILGVTIKSYDIVAYNLTSKKPIDMPPLMKGLPIGPTTHNTNDISEASGTTDAEQYTRATMNGNMGTVRVHAYIDYREVWENLLRSYQGQHAGSSGIPETGKAVDGNQRTIGIEIIMNGDPYHPTKNVLHNGETVPYTADLIAQDKKAMDNAARYIAYLYSIYPHWDNDVDNTLFTHNYWVNRRKGLTGTPDELTAKPDGYKGCPIYIRPNWEMFKGLVKKYLAELIVKTPEQQENTEPEKIYRVQVGALSVKQNAVNLRDKLIAAGFKDAYVL
jgi:hypothetical protein